MEFRIVTKRCPLVITDQPIVHEGKPKDGLADWDNKRILIGAHVRPEERLILLLHEIWHCWRFHSPKAHEVEEECDQFAIAAETAIEDLEDQGGVRALMRLGVSDPDASLAPESSTLSLANYDPPADRTDMLREVKFKHVVDNAHWAAVLDECRRLQIDVADAWVKYEPDMDTGELVPRVITTMHNLRVIGARSGKHKRENLPEYLKPDGTWVDVWVDAEPPTAARASVERTDVEGPIMGIAYLERSMQWREVGPDEWVPTRAWRPGCEGPQLGKCAVAAAYRTAYQDLIGRLTVREEDDPAGSPRPIRPVEGERARPRKAARGSYRAGSSVGGTPTLASMAADMLDPPDDPQWAARWINDSTPDSRRGLVLELVNRRDYGTADANALVDKMAEKFKRTLAASYQAFAAVVLKTVGSC